MGTKLTQATANRIAEEHQAGSQVYDEDVAGLRIVVGSKSASYKLVGRINDGSDRYVSIIVGRTDEVSLKTARDKANEIKLALRRGDDPRSAKRMVPCLRTAWEADARLTGCNRPACYPRTNGLIGLVGLLLGRPSFFPGDYAQPMPCKP